MNDDLTALFLLYIHKRGAKYNEIGSWLGIAGKTASDKLRKGVSLWTLEDILCVAEHLRIPIQAIREKIRYERKEEND